ncbi:MAG TPA: 2-oxoglutarate dehydrogenase complex dihydrolipoyllysine-residue succinyltransferase [Vicinamibacterales bacterium]|nr:2-oxoglutarate dehydrogenase complex dihydrolipoyllysine-residue succinyltransferase [Vicinamibacterales bacterium]
MPANIVVPEMGESIVDARVAKWLKREGEPVSAGEALVELETDKIDVEVSAPQGGVLQQITRGPGEDVKIGEVIGVIDASAPASHPPSPPAPASQGAPSAAAQEDEKTRATPSARRLADQHEVEISALKGTGEAGRVTRRDVETYIAAGRGGEDAARQPLAGVPTAARTAQPAVAQAPWPEAPAAARPRPAAGERREERVRMSKRRATVARRLVEAQRDAAMLTTFNEVDMTGIMTLRERRKQAFKEKHGVSLGIASFFVKAAVGPLREFPRINAEIQGDVMVLKHYYDIGVAVGAEEGLVVPVLRDVDRMSFAEIELKIREYAKKAADGTLTLDDLRGGTFTITNGGVFGSLVSTPIINPPQVGILGLHKIQDRPVAVGRSVEVRPMMYIALTYDHRIVDGAEAVRFLVRVKELSEDPGTLLLES